MFRVCLSRTGEIWCLSKPRRSIFGVCLSRTGQFVGSVEAIQVKSDARHLMLAAAAGAYARSIQRVLALRIPAAPPIGSSYHCVYALTSPLWGRYYVGACGFTTTRAPLARWVGHIRLAKL